MWSEDHVSENEPVRGRLMRVVLVKNTDSWEHLGGSVR